MNALRPVPRGRFNLVDGLPCLTCGAVALDWENRYRRKGLGYFPRKGEPACLHVTLRRQEYYTKTWAMWEGGTVLTAMPVGTDQETLRQAALYMMGHLYWPVREFQGWESVLATLAKIEPRCFPEVVPTTPPDHSPAGQ